MPNYCWNTVTITGPEEDIQEIKDAEFSFCKLVPLDAEDSRGDGWGTDRDRFDYTVKAEGRQGMRITFTTAWQPPLKFLETLLSQRPGCWIKEEWYTEDGDSGVWIGVVPEGTTPEIKELRWDEGCLEENAHLFRRGE